MSATATLDAKKGSASTDHADDELRLRNARAKCLDRIRRAVSANSKILSEADIRAYEDDVISDRAFAISGVTDTKKMIAMIWENISTHIPKLEAESRALADTFERKISEAQRNGWISEQSARRWIEKRLGNKQVKYWDKKKFIEVDLEKFPKYFENWKRVGEAAKALRKNPHMKSVTVSDVPQIAAFMNEKQFLNLSFEAREALLKTVSAAVTAKEKKMPELFTKAKAMLNAAVQRQALSPSKVGSWLERIFKSGAKAEQIEQFLSNGGPMPIQKLIQNWTEASKHFQKLEAKRKSLGTPRNFHFVKMDVFLNWRYEQRTSYLEEAEHRFSDINKEPALFMKIRHELGAKDWDSAEGLIEEAKKEDWGTENGKKLQSMERFLREHRTKDDQRKKKGVTEDPTVLIKEMQDLIRELPPQLQRTYIKSLNRGYQTFWALSTLMYNRVWCHQHNFLDTGKERRMEGDAKEQTRERVKKGHKRYGWEVNVVKGDTNTRAAVRDQSGVKGAQILYTDEQSDETLVDEIHEQKNDRNFWYWTSMIPEGVTYAEHLHVVQNLHPKMKRIARKMEELGVHYPLTTASITPASLQTKAKKGDGEVDHPSKT